VRNSGNYRRKSRRSRGLRRRIIAGVILAACVTLAASLWSRDRAAHASARLPDVRTPADLVRDLPAMLEPSPGPAWSAADVRNAGQQLHDAFSSATAGAQGWSLAVVDSGGNLLFDDRASRAVTPASVQKLIVAATALDVLGPTFRYHTVLAARAPAGADGTLDGNIWLIGSGDPSLTRENLQAGVGVLARSGLRRVDGNVAVDSSAMRGPEQNPHWSQDDADEDYAAPTNAVSIDEDTVESTQTVDGVQEHFWTAVHGVNRWAGTVVDELLRQRRIAVSGKPAVGAAPLDTVVLWDHRSDPLRTLETHMLFYSDNHYAEQLLRSLGEDRGPGSDAAGLQAETQFLNERGIPRPGLHLADGSGLSDSNRIAAITLARVLADAQARGGNASMYMLLPAGGREGTLRGYDFTTALGRVRAKSGHIGGVASLAGYVNTQHHGRVAFAFLINGSPGDPDAAIVRAVDRLAAL
jgi:serine-type D-Ala-D-Ala carboxypeptidase/endopeptidase (penicillin-binding protein 4)